MKYFKKTDDAYKTIGEVAKGLGLIDKKTGNIQTHTLRYWETQFKQIRPSIKAGNRRYYSKKDFTLIKNIQFLLKERGLTINGVKKHLLKQNSFELDEIMNSSIKSKNINLKSNIKKISKLVKEIKKLG